MVGVSDTCSPVGMPNVGLRQAGHEVEAKLFLCRLAKVLCLMSLRSAVSKTASLRLSKCNSFVLLDLGKGVLFFSNIFPR